jgi:hypothetical protein
MYTRASASDYDDFQAKGWTTKELIPLMRKHETYQRACNNREIHGFEGPIKGMSRPEIPPIPCQLLVLVIRFLSFLSFLSFTLPFSLFSSFFLLPLLPPFCHYFPSLLLFHHHNEPY